MTTEQKIIKTKVGVLELAKHLGNVSNSNFLDLRLRWNVSRSKRAIMVSMLWGPNDT